jgi:hypothetical protein
VQISSSFQIPDLSALGFTWPKSTSFLAGVDASTPRTPDDVAGDNRRPPADHDGADAGSAVAGFTTAP